MVFDTVICFAPSERKYADSLGDALAPLESAGKTTLWWNRKLTAGSRFTDAVRDRIEQADIVLLLVSKAFLGSNFCQDQMNHAIDRGINVVPIVLESCDWMRTAARQPDCLPSDGNPVSAWKTPDEAYADIAQGVEAACDRYASDIKRWAEELGPEEQFILGKLYPDHRRDGLDMWDAKYVWDTTFLPTFRELLSEKMFIDRDFYFSVTFPFWRQRFWLTKRGQRVYAARMETEETEESS